jgi:hypothetical protein
MKIFNQNRSPEQSIAQRLEQIVVYNGKLSAEKIPGLPVVSVILKNGTTFTGFPCEIFGGLNHPVLGFVVGSNSNAINDSSEMAFVDIDQIAALKFPRMSDANLIFRAHEADLSKRWPPLTKLEVRRRVEAKKAEGGYFRLFEIDASQFSNEEKEWGLLLGFLEVLNGCLLALATNALGAEALRTVERVMVKKADGRTKKIEFTDGTLVCFIDVTNLDFIDSAKVSALVENAL